MILGLAIALGLTKLYPLAIGIVLYYVIFQLWHRRIPRRIPPFTLWLIIACVMSSVWWNPNGGKILLFCVNAFTVWFAACYLRKNTLTLYPILAIAIFAVAYSIYEYNIGIVRIHGLSRNASVMGIAGLALFPSGMGAVLSGISISRTAAIMWGILALANPTRKIIAATTICLLLTIGITAVVAPSRISIPGLERDVKLREATITGTSQEIAPSAIAPNLPTPQDVNWSIWGYGYGAYSLSTGRIQPHNSFVLSWYELGILAIPFWLAVTWLWWKLPKRNYYLPLIVIGCALFTDEFYGSMEGPWMLLAIWHGTKDLPHPFTWMLRSGKIREWRQSVQKA